MLAFGLLCAILAAILALAIGSMLVLRAETQQAILVTGERSRAAADMAIATLLCRRYEKDLFLTLDDKATRHDYFVKWEAALAELQLAIERYAALASTDAQRGQVATWREQSATYERAVREVERAIGAGLVLTPQDANAVLTPYKDPIRQLTNSAHAKADADGQLLVQKNARLTAIGDQSLVLLLGGGLAALLFAVGWAVFFPLRLLGPIAALQQATRQFAEGKLEARATVGRSDEFGALATSFNQMAEQIRVQIVALDQRELVQQQNDQLLALLELVRDLETPVIQLHDRVLLVPIVGSLDTQRVALLQQRVVEAAHTRGAQTIILDLTGMALIDTQVATAMERLVTALRLLGAEPIVSGISTHVAQTAVELGVSFGGSRVVARVQEALSLSVRAAT
jgi:anti-anti-sigma regulatory factor/HAMP domain-containing protein